MKICAKKVYSIKPISLLLEQHTLAFWCWLVLLKKCDAQHTVVVITYAHRSYVSTYVHVATHPGLCMAGPESLIVAPWGNGDRSSTICLLPWARFMLLCQLLCGEYIERITASHRQGGVAPHLSSSGCGEVAMSSQPASTVVALFLPACGPSMYCLAGRGVGEGGGLRSNASIRASTRSLSRGVYGPAGVRAWSAHTALYTSPLCTHT